jgi:hypothetical protein
VPIGESNAPAINSFLASRGLSYLCDSGNPETSTGASLLSLADGVWDPTRTNAVLLLTDGDESSECTDHGDGAAGAAALFERDVATYVVGFVLGASSDRLASVASNGGTGTYHDASDLAGLVTALDGIAASLVQCEVTLSGVDTDATPMSVHFDEASTPLRSGEWTYDPDTGRMTFLGAACDRITRGEVTDIHVDLGCPLR